MKKYWKIVGVVALIAGILYYPALKLYLYLTKAKTERSGQPEETDARIKTFISGYRGKYKSGHHSHDGNPNATLV